ncbi:Hypothetical protein, putative, partial [Bodo saltans]
MPVYRIVGKKWTAQSKIVLNVDPGKGLRSALPNLSKKLGIPSMKLYGAFRTSSDRQPNAQLDLDVALEAQGVNVGDYIFVAPLDSAPQSPDGKQLPMATQAEQSDQTAAAPTPEISEGQIQQSATTPTDIMPTYTDTTDPDTSSKAPTTQHLQLPVDATPPQAAPPTEPLPQYQDNPPTSCELVTISPSTDDSSLDKQVTAPNHNQQASHFWQDLTHLIQRSYTTPLTQTETNAIKQQYFLLIDQTHSSPKPTTSHELESVNAQLAALTAELKAEKDRASETDSASTGLRHELESVNAQLAALTAEL